MRLIDADGIKSAKYHDLPYTHIHPVGVDVQAYEMGWNDALDAVADSAPTVDANLVKKGHWIEKDDECECPFCGKAWNYVDNCTETFNFCPNCGARMDEVTNE